MAWKRTSDHWYTEAVDRDSDNRSLIDRASALMKSWLNYSVVRNEETFRLKIEYGHALDPETEKVFGVVMCIILGDLDPVQFYLDEMRWTIDKMRWFYDNSDDPIAEDKDHRKDLDGFLGVLETGVKEAEALDPKRAH